jgi:hypothetical protein
MCARPGRPRKRSIWRSTIASARASSEGLRAYFSIM